MTAKTSSARSCLFGFSHNRKLYSRGNFFILCYFVLVLQLSMISFELLINLRWRVLFSSSGILPDS